MADGDPHQPWLKRNSILALAIAAFLAYTVIAVLVGVGLLVLGGLGSETITTKQLDASGQTTSQTVVTKDSVPVLVIFGAIAAGGWLLIPLKFTWDEFAKSRDIERRERENEQEDKRAIATRMRELVTASITNYYGPMVYRHLSVKRWSERAAIETDSQRRTDALHRLLYSIGQLYMLYERIRENGRVFC